MSQGNEATSSLPPWLQSDPAPVSQAPQQQAPQQAPPVQYRDPAQPPPQPVPQSVGQPASLAPKPDTAAPWILGAGVDQDMTDPKASAASLSGIRFWMPKGSNRQIIFLTDGAGKAGPISIYEHNPPIGVGKQRFLHWFTCLEPMGIPCPMCQFADANNGTGRRYKALVFTVIDLSEFKRQDGTTVKNQKKLLMAKKDTAETLARKYLARIETSQSLQFAMFRVYRGAGDTTPAVGSDYEFMKMVDPAQIADATQLDYLTLLKPDQTRMIESVNQMTRDLSLGAAVPTPTEGAKAQVQY